MLIRRGPLRPRALVFVRWPRSAGRGGGEAAVGADLRQALDVLRAVAAQVALDLEVLDSVAQLDRLLLGQVLDVGVRVDADLVEQLVGGRAADAVDVGEPDLDPLVEREVDSRDPCH